MLVTLIKKQEYKIAHEIKNHSLAADQTKNLMLLEFVSPKLTPKLENVQMLI